MNVVKQIVAVVWPVIKKVLEKQVEKTESPIDDYVLIAVETAVLAWLNSKDDDTEE